MEAPYATRPLFPPQRHTLILVAALVACDGDGAGKGPNGFSCAPGAAPPSVSMRRLTGAQYRNTVSDFLEQSLGGGASAVMSAVAKQLAQHPAASRPPMPKDKHGAYRRMDQDVQDLHVEATYRIAFAVAEQVTKPANLAALLGMLWKRRRPRERCQMHHSFCDDLRRAGVSATARP